MKSYTFDISKLEMVLVLNFKIMIKYHAKFGKVEVVKVEGSTTTLRLESGEEKNFHTDFCKLSDTPVLVIVAVPVVVVNSRGDKKRSSDRRSLEKKPAAEFWNADGTKNWDARNAFEDERNAAKWGSKSL